MKKRTFIRKEDFLLGIGAGLLILAVLSRAYAFWESKKTAAGKVTENESKKVEHFPAVSPTPVPPTPTPTLSPAELAVRAKKRAEALNQKYGPCRSVPILMYHHVMEAKDATAIGAGYLNVPPETFRSQIDYLLNRGYQVIGLDEMMAELRSGGLPPKPLVLTFDDGYSDFYDYVYPVLKEKNLKATVFVISQFTGGERYLNWGQVKEMSDSGYVLIGDHTLNHRSLPSLSEDEGKNQIIAARLIIEDHLKKAVNFFAYPYGGVNAAAEKILAEAGFSGAVTTTPGLPQCALLPYQLSRIRIGASSLTNYGL